VTVNLIVLAATLLVLGFLAVWTAHPNLRPWFEAPKYQVLQWDRRWPAAERDSENQTSVWCDQQRIDVGA